MQNKLTNLIKSRKFWAAVAGILVVSLRAFVPDFPLEDENLIYMIVVIASYIIGTGIEDAGHGDYLTILGRKEQETHA
jgi:hypothetical protein